MAQQKGMKRAAKVADRKRKTAARQKVASIRRFERQAELAAKEAEEPQKQSKK